MQDIANKLGITKMTVSRYLSNPSSVSQATGEKIQSAVDELGFVPSRVPSILANKSSRSVGVLIPSFSNMVFADLIHGLEEEARAHDYTLLIMHTGYDQEAEERQVEAMLSYQVDGIVLTEPQHSARTLKRLEAMAVPCVETMSLPMEPVDLAVGLNHRELMYRCTRALLCCGRKMPLYLGVRLDIRTMQRQEGYTRAMEEFGYQPFVLDSDARSNFTMAGSLMLQALQLRPEVDAVLATNDDVAVGAMMACQSLRISIPDRISILGYNGLNVSAATIPPLCSIRTPRAEMGRLAMQMLLQKIRGHSPAPRVVSLTCDITPGRTVTKAEFSALQQAAAQPWSDPA